ncbi:hypothetical protein E1288_35390 [Saccharopolyspora elongata]|uniref:Uncharacterized protein n=1 Tax=Saccharopolyspora elongata TaxID=2530387 RepID=A0A4R4Y7D8_9PSEU|nr:hypothetical protein E1288_35390 [Saccharopolyspora elongata]
MSLICCSRTERGKACPDTAALIGVGKRECPKRLNRKGLSTGAGRAGGPARSSEEALVIGVERRGRVIRGCCSFDQPGASLGGVA